MGDRQAQAEALAALGALALDTVGPAEARAYYDQALHLAREVHSPIDEAHALVGTARCAQRAGDRPAALAAAEQALAGYERSGAAETARTREYCAILRSLPSDTPVRSDASLGKLP